MTFTDQHTHNHTQAQSIPQPCLTFDESSSPACNCTDAPLFARRYETAQPAEPAPTITSAHRPHHLSHTTKHEGTHAHGNVMRTTASREDRPGHAGKPTPAAANGVQPRPLPLVNGVMPPTGAGR